jgi:hypothetical protein
MTGVGDELQARDEAEERGRLYMEALAQPFDPTADIGSLFDEEEADVEADSNTQAPPRSAARNSSAGDDLPLRRPPTADPRFPGENDVHPFYIPHATADQIRITPTNTHPALFQLYLLVAWLHTQCKLAFTACAAVLIVFANILLAAGITLEHDHPSPYVTLTSVLRNLGVEPTFAVLPLCPECLEPHPPSRTATALCKRCETPLFRSGQPRGSQDLRPHLQLPVMSIEAQLHAMLAVPGMEAHLEAWRHKPREEGKYQDVFDGRVARGLKGADGCPFFENPLPANCSELRVGAVLGLDWYLAFSTPNRREALLSES